MLKLHLWLFSSVSGKINYRAWDILCVKTFKYKFNILLGLRLFRVSIHYCVNIGKLYLLWYCHHLHFNYVGIKYFHNMLFISLIICRYVYSSIPFIGYLCFCDHTSHLLTCVSLTTNFNFVNLFRCVLVLYFINYISYFILFLYSNFWGFSWIYMFLYCEAMTLSLIVNLKILIWFGLIFIPSSFLN